MQLGNFRNGTPGDALDVITDTLPIDLFIKAEMQKCNYRIRPHFDDDWTGYGSKTKLGHILKAKLTEIELNMPYLEGDGIDEQEWNNKYTISSNRYGNDEYKGLRCYTDGSKTKTSAGPGLQHVQLLLLLHAEYAVKTEYLLHCQHLQILDHIEYTACIGSST